MTENTVKLSRWSIGVMITIGIILLGQSAAGIWWASKQSTTMTFMARDVAELRTEMKERTKLRYTRDDANTDKLVILRLIEEVSQRLSDHKEHLK